MASKTPNGLVTPTRFWISFFALWAVFLSGILGNFVGSPGVIQAVRLNHLLKSREAQMAKLEDQVIGLQTEAEQLEKSKLVQQREIRKVLGYVAPDEIVFDFSTADAI